MAGDNNSNNVIVFGATGEVGSHVARTAEQLGANVFLAVRNLEKPVPGISAADEAAAAPGSAGGGSPRFRRVRADLSDPESVRAAAAEAQASRAFVYATHGGHGDKEDDHMRGAFEALRSAGVGHVVLLSSYSVQGDPRDVSMARGDDFISWSHAQAEISLAAVYDESSTIIVRPNFFASNIMWWKDLYRTGTAAIPSPDAPYDWLAPTDIGRVAGTLLVKGLDAAAAAASSSSSSSKSSNVVFMSGPNWLTQREALQHVAAISGRPISVEAIRDEDAAVALVMKSGAPEGMARAALAQWAARQAGTDDARGGPFAESLETVERITGRKALTFPEWARENIEQVMS